MNAMRYVATSVTIVSVIGFMSNIIALMILLKCRRMNFQIKVICVNMVVTDLLTSTFTFVDSIATVKSLHLIPAWCVTRCIIGVMLITASLFFMTLLAIDRLFSITMALRYHVLVTQNRTIAVSVLTWIVSLLVTSLSYVNGFERKAPCICFDNEGNKFITLIFRNICFLLIIISYSIIFWMVLKQNRTIQCMGNKNRFNFGPTIKISAIVGALCVMYFPKNAYFIYITATGKKVQDSLKLYAVLAYIEKLNSFINPFLYVWRFTECRIQIIKLFCRFNDNMLRKANSMDYDLAGFNVTSNKSSTEQTGSSIIDKPNAHAVVDIVEVSVTDCSSNIL